MLVREVVITGVIGRWFHRRGWGAVTLPTLGGNIKIRYWLERDPAVAEHEWSIHVPQIRELGRLRYLWLYAKLYAEGYWVCRRWMGLGHKDSARCAYRHHPMEHENWRDNV